MKKRWLVLVALVTLMGNSPTAHATPGQGDAQPAANIVPEDVSQVIQPLCAKYDVPGMVIAVVKDGVVIARGAAGVRKVGDETPVEIGDRFHLGSCTKSMTATMIGTLVEEGRMSWTTTLGEVFPTRVDAMAEGWADVTVEQLLSHHAGAPGELSRDGLWAELMKGKGTPREQRQRLLDGVIKHPSVHPPGGKFLYSNAGVAMAGAMAEKTTDTPWEELMEQRIFRPLKMKSAGFGAPGTKGVVDQPRGHTVLGTFQEPGPGSDNPAAIGPAGTVHASITDWAMYVDQHARGERENRDGGAWLLKPETFVRLHTPVGKGPENYALGWIVTQRPWAKGAGGQGRVLTHNGSNTMWMCATWVAPEKSLAVVVASNRGGNPAAKACDDAASLMLQRFARELPATPPEPDAKDAR